MDELQISGKRFISARRIARENGYTSDYIGQLIRGGKIVGQKVGRAWYVDAASFSVYLGSEGSTEAALPVETTVAQAQPAAPEPKIEKAAAPAVKEVTIEEVKKEEPVAAPIAVAEEKLSAPAPAKEISQRVPLKIVKEEEPVETGGLRYFADDAPLLPDLPAAVPVKISAAPVAVEPETETVADREPHRSRALSLAGIALVGIIVLAASTFVSSKTTLHLSAGAGNTAASYFSFDW